MVPMDSLNSLSFNFFGQAIFSESFGISNPLTTAIYSTHVHHIPTFEIIWLDVKLSLVEYSQESIYAVVHLQLLEM